MWLLVFSLVLAMFTTLVSPYDTTMVNRLLRERETLIQDGLSFFNGTSITGLRGLDEGHSVRCLIVIENWTKWLLGFPEFYTDYGSMQTRFHVREVFSAHREVIVAVSEQDAMTGAAGVATWTIGDALRGPRLIVMWAVPYNQLMYNAYFGVGVAHLSSRFTRDLLPYWYHRMYAGEGDPDVFGRAAAGHKVVFKGEEVFVMGQMEGDAYHPLLNVSVMPWSTKNLAPSVWHQLYLKSAREAQRFSNVAREKQRRELLILSLILSFNIAGLLQ